MYSTDHGPHMNSWPDAGMTPFRNEKNSKLGGAFRVPTIVRRWPGQIPAGVVSNEIVSHLDWPPTFVAMAGDPDIAEKLKRGYRMGNKTFKVHLDGHNLLPFLTTKGAKSPRPGFLYFDDDGHLVGLRYDNWKLVFMEQRVEGSLRIWQEPFVPLRFPKLFNLRTDPYERADITSNTYWDWILDHVYLFVPAHGLVAQFLGTFREFPPRQKAASFTIDQVVEKMMAAAGAGGR
jgi:arylsulfatase